MATLPINNEMTKLTKQDIQKLIADDFGIPEEHVDFFVNLSYENGKSYFEDAPIEGFKSLSTTIMIDNKNQKVQIFPDDIKNLLSKKFNISSEKLNLNFKYQQQYSAPVHELLAVEVNQTVTQKKRLKP